MKANRKHKDSLFTTLFGEPDKFLELYNALTGNQYPMNTVMQPATLTDVLFMDQQNDVAFVVGDTIVVLIEHQSTISKNLPLRLLIYIARVYEMIIDTKAVYKDKLVMLPKPEFIVLYNGTKTFSSEKVYRLSDAFKQSALPGLGGVLELSVRVVNINKGYNQQIVSNSSCLSGYVEFIAMVRTNQKSGNNLQDAITNAVADCIQQGILADFLKRHGSEVMNMLLQEFNIDIAKQVWQEEAREEAHEEGRVEGREEGREEGFIQSTINIIKGLRLSVTEAMELMKLGVEYHDRLIIELQRQGIEYTE
jgi:predicted transposase YdaD